jgi:hypothetical protein
MARKPPYRLVGDALSHDTVECLREMLAHAEKGRLIGIAFAAMYRGGAYAVNSAGEARRSPTFARGMVGELDMDLHHLVLNQRGSS